MTPAFHPVDEPAGGPADSGPALVRSLRRLDVGAASLLTALLGMGAIAASLFFAEITEVLPPNLPEGEAPGESPLLPVDSPPLRNTIGLQPSTLLLILAYCATAAVSGRGRGAGRLACVGLSAVTITQTFAYARERIDTMTLVLSQEVFTGDGELMAKLTEQGAGFGYGTGLWLAVSGAAAIALAALTMREPRTGRPRPARAEPPRTGTDDGLDLTVEAEPDPVAIYRHPR